MRSFTREELSKCDGSGGNPVYVAFEGKIYDVSSGPDWAAGSHFEHFAGGDLTKEMADAPHGGEVLDGYAIVGELAP